MRNGTPSELSVTPEFQWNVFPKASRHSSVSIDAFNSNECSKNSIYDAIVEQVSVDNALRVRYQNMAKTFCYRNLIQLQVVSRMDLIEMESILKRNGIHFETKWIPF